MSIGKTTKCTLSKTLKADESGRWIPNSERSHWPIWVFCIVKLCLIFEGEIQTLHDKNTQDFMTLKHLYTGF